MVLTNTPASPYPRTDWLKKPKNAKDDEGFDKYMYKNGESLASIAAAVSKPWRKLTGNELTHFNWNTATPNEVNYYLKEHNGCTRETTDGNNYRLSESDTNPFVWVPKMVKLPSGKHRSPGKKDVGHVALDTDKKKHINTLVIRPVYTITLELGDIDALFDPAKDDDMFKTATTVGNAPHTKAGCRQRLQALGYNYRPIRHKYSVKDFPRRVGEAAEDGAAKRCWKHWQKIHTKTGDVKPPHIDKLKEEIQNNILCVPKGNLPTKKAKIYEGRLPRKDEFGMIRLPGGFTFNHSASFSRRDHDANYSYQFYGNSLTCRHDIENKLYEENEFLGKIPLIARVHRVMPNGKLEPAEGVNVYFQLVKPDPLPDDNPLKAPKLRDKVMDYTKDVQIGKLDFTNAPSPLTTSLGWATVKRIALSALAKATGVRAAHITTEVNSATANVAERAKLKADVETYVNWALPHQPPYEIDNKGPKKFLDDFATTNAATDPDDPQALNAPVLVNGKYAGGKRDLPVIGGDADGKFREGVFEVGKKKKRVGLHSPRDNKHADYGTLTVAEKVEPTVEKDESTNEDVKRHNHAVQALTNDKGIAGVIFMPSRIGGDQYKLRAYVGPGTLHFDGTDPEGPVVTTGTMVVWRNIRLNRYLQMKVAPPGGAMRTAAGASAALKTMLRNSDNGVSTEVKVWNGASLTREVPEVYLDRKCIKVDPTPKRFGTTGYRPISVESPGLIEQYARCYCELIIDAEKEEMTKAVYDAAYDSGIAALKRAGVGTIEWEKLIIKDWTSPFLLNIRSKKQYNTLVASNANKITGLNIQRVYNAISNNMLIAMMDNFSGGGVLPGLTLVQVPRGDTWEQIGPALIMTSGVALSGRGAFLAYTSDIYKTLIYSGTANAAHELGHVLTRQHAPKAPNAGPEKECHQLMADAVCGMSYTSCYGEYCGRCVMCLRGYPVRTATTNKNNVTGVVTETIKYEVV